jgi:hypothetical protein
VVVQFEDWYQGMPLGMPHIEEIEEQLPLPEKAARVNLSG